MAIRKKLRGGFTLVELMIVVAIVGVLAVLAVYGVRKYIANAKTAEAKNSLGQMGKDAVTAFEGERMTNATISDQGSTGIIRAMCASATKSVPDALSKVKGAKYQSVPADWSVDTGAVPAAGFSCLKFEMTAPQYYMYGYTATGLSSTGDKFNATAEGDLNGDTVASTFSLVGEISSGRLKVAPAIGEVSPDE